MCRQSPQTSNHKTIYIGSNPIFNRDLINEQREGDKEQRERKRKKTALALECTHFQHNTIKNCNSIKKGKQLRIINEKR